MGLEVTAGEQTRLDIRIDKACAEVLRQNVPRSLITNFILGAILASAIWFEKEDLRSGYWFVANTLIVVFRLGLYRCFSEPDFTTKPWERWLKLNRWMSIASGLSWGVAAILFISADALMVSAFVIVLVAGISAGAAQSMAPDRVALPLFLSAALVPLIAALMVQPPILMKIIGGCIALYLVVVVSIGRNLHEVLRSTFAQRFENEAMVEKLSRSIAEAEAANQAKTNFLSSMSHELRTPLNSVIGYTQLLQSDPTLLRTTDHDASLEQILKSGQHLLRLVQDILDLNRIDTGNVEIVLNDIDPVEVANDCLLMLKRQAVSKGISIEADLPEKSFPQIKDDLMRLRQVLLNIGDNAIKYNRKDGTVRLSLQILDDQYVRFSVQDDGPGIPDELHDAVFEPFNRLGMESKEVEGTGIGMTISRNLIEAMNGRIEYSSELGSGSTFWVDVPISSTPKAEAISALEIKEVREDQEPAPLNDEESASSHKKVLYVEDIRPNQSLMELIFERMPTVDLTVADSAEDGLDLMASLKFDLVLMDINLPGMNGLEATKRIKSDPAFSSIPVVAVTAAATDEDIELGWQAGFDAYTTKPVNIQGITDLVLDILYT